MTDPTFPATDADEQRLLAIGRQIGMAIDQPKRDVIYRDGCLPEGRYVNYERMYWHLIKRHGLTQADAGNLVRVLRIISRQHGMAEAGGRQSPEVSATTAGAAETKVTSGRTSSA